MTTQGTTLPTPEERAEATLQIFERFYGKVTGAMLVQSLAQAYKETDRAIVETALIMACPVCDGRGYNIVSRTVPVHAPGCAGDCHKHGCPVPEEEPEAEQCEYCGRMQQELAKILGVELP